MTQTPQKEPGGEPFPRREFEAVCFHALGLIDQNREYLQMHLKESGDDRTRQALADMELETARLDRTLGEMMDLMALEQEPPRPRWFDLCDVLRQASALQEEVALQVRVQLVVECEVESCPVRGVPEEAELLVFHLLSNALLATAPGGKVRLQLCCTEESRTLTVTDDGCGLPGPANWQENRRRFLGGAGAGLKLCRAVCRRAGWGFSLEDRPRRGAEARVTLPAAEADTPPLHSTVELYENGGQPLSRLRWQLARELRLLAEKA